MDLTSLLHALEGCLQEELSAQHRIVTELDAQERAIVANDSEELSATLTRLAHELSGNEARALRRRVVLAKLASVWEISAGALTLTSVAERAGERASRLLGLRDELRVATKETSRRNRRLAALSRAHRRVVGELLRTVLGAADAATLEAGGSLVDAQA